MSKFTLFNKKISFPESADRFYATMQELYATLEIAKNDFIEFYRTKGSICAVLENYMMAAGIITKQRAINDLYKRLPSFGIYDVTADAFEEECWILDDAGEAYDEIVDAYNEIEDELKIEKEYRAERKASRGQFVGGGFGVDGAIKGAVTAGALNMATGLGHSVFNAIGNLGSEIAASNAKDRLYASNDTYHTLCMGIVGSIFDIYFAYTDFVDDYFEDSNITYFTAGCFDEERAKALFQNAKEIPEKREELLVEALRLHPYCQEMLEYVFENYPKERKHVCEMAEFFQVDLQDCYESIFENLYSCTKKADGKDLLSTREQILNNMNEYGIKSSATLDQLDKTYLGLILKNDYQTALPGERTTAVEQIRSFDTSDAIKKEFVKDHSIWELFQENNIKISEKKQDDLVYAEYGKMKQFPDEKMATVLDTLFAALGRKPGVGRFSDSEKEKYFRLLSDAQNNEQPIIQNTLDKKEKLLANAIHAIKMEVSYLGATDRAHVDYQRETVNNAYGKLEFATIESGEYILLLYHASCDDASYYKKGFVITDKRIASNVGRTFEMKIDKPLTFTAGGFFSDDITMGVEGREYKLDVSNLSGKKQLAPCLQQACKYIMEAQDSVTRIDVEHSEDMKEQKMLCVQDHPFLIQYFDLQVWAEQVISEGSAAIAQRKQRQEKEQVRIILQTCNKSPKSVAEVWSRLVNSQLQETSYAAALETLSGYLYHEVSTANTLKQLDAVLQAREEILQVSKNHKIEELDAEIADRTVVVKNQNVSKIMAHHSEDDPISIAEVWEKLCNCTYEKAFYEAQLEELYSKLLTIAQNAESVACLERTETARQKIAPLCDEEKIQVLKEAIEGRRSEAERLDEIRRQQQVAADIRGECDLSNVESVIAGWDKFINSDCDESFYQEYLDDLRSALVRLVDHCWSIPAATELRDALVENNAERYENYIKQAEDKIHQLDVAQRTYRNILFDSLEDLAFAKEEEKRLDIIMRMVAKEDQDSINNAISQISESTSKIKEVYLNILNGYTETLTTEMKTYRGVTYDSVEQAEEAKNAYLTTRQIMDGLNMANEQAVQEAYEKISALNHPITAPAMEQLKVKLDAFDIRNRTVDGILFDSLDLADTARKEYAYIQEQLSALDDNDEVAMQTAKENIAACTTAVKNKYADIVDQKLTAYDVKMRTFRGTVYETRDQVVELQQEETAIRNILQTVRDNDEASMIRAVGELEGLTTFLKDVPIATINRMMTAYDIKVRTVEGVLYDTREEANLVSGEIARANEIMQRVSPDDEQSILNAQQEILSLSTKIKDVKYAQLNQMWEAYDLRMRTYCDIVFETRKQAQIAQQSHTEFLNLFNTLDLGQRKSLVALNNFIEDNIPVQLKPKVVQMVEEVKKILDEREYIYVRDTQIDINAQKKESEELYKRIEAILPNMTRFRMNTQQMEALKNKHYASLNVAKKLFSFVKSKL